MPFATCQSILDQSMIDLYIQFTVVAKIAESKLYPDRQIAVV